MRKLSQRRVSRPSAASTSTNQGSHYTSTNFTISWPSKPSCTWRHLRLGVGRSGLHWRSNMHIMGYIELRSHPRCIRILQIQRILPFLRRRSSTTNTSSSSYPSSSSNASSSSYTSTTIVQVQLANRGTGMCRRRGLYRLGKWKL